MNNNTQLNETNQASPDQNIYKQHSYNIKKFIDIYRKESSQMIDVQSTASEASSQDFESSSSNTLLYPSGGSNCSPNYLTLAQYNQHYSIQGSQQTSFKKRKNTDHDSNTYDHMDEFSDNNNRNNENTHQLEILQNMMGREKKGQKFNYKKNGKLKELFEIQDKKKYFEKPQIFSDRYIPLRKNKSYKLMVDQINSEYHFQEHGKENQSSLTQNSPSMERDDGGQMQISNLYQDYVLHVDTQQKQSQTFQNLNFMKFNSLQTTSIDNNRNVLQGQSSMFGIDENSFKYQRKGKKINKIPYKVLDAPALQDDFYLNLIDWSSQNILSVGLSSCVYLWSADSSRVTKLCDLGLSNSVTSVGWSLKGPHLSVGTNNGEVQIWDAVKLKKTRTFQGHQARVGTLCWNNNLLSSGSRDKNILQRDIRSPHNYITKLTGHKQEVCGLKWSFDEQYLASGGNDNKLFVWNQHSTSPILKFNSHQAAVKALAWSPHQHGLLVSGGGTADRTIRFWNTLQSQEINCIDTGSQVCNLIFSKSENQLVSTHGYSLNQVIVWDYPEMEKIATLTGHTYRVLYLAMSPSGDTIVTGAGDETLRFWNIFNNKNKIDNSEDSLLLEKNNYLR